MTNKPTPFFKTAAGQGDPVPEDKGDSVPRNLMAVWMRAYRNNKHCKILAIKSDKTRGYAVMLPAHRLFATIIMY